MKRRILLEGKNVTVGAVDLGLPSGLLWATCNLGATNSEEAGLYFSWGNIEGHVGGTYNFSSSKYSSTPGKALTRNIPANATYDAARYMLGDGWRLPTKDEFNELYENTDSEWVSNYNGTGVAGRKFMKKSDHSVYIFFPACGYYSDTSITFDGMYGYCWSSTYRNSIEAYVPSFSSNSVNPFYDANRYHGYPCRAVIDTR